MMKIKGLGIPPVDYTPSGMPITTENSASLTLRSPNGAENVLLRSELTSLQSTHRSLMPEGFENALEPAAMADLIAYLLAGGPRPAAK